MMLRIRRPLMQMSAWVIRLDRWLAAFYDAFGQDPAPPERFDPPCQSTVVRLIRVRRQLGVTQREGRS